MTQSSDIDPARDGADQGVRTIGTLTWDGPRWALRAVGYLVVLVLVVVPAVFVAAILVVECLG